MYTERQRALLDAMWQWAVNTSYDNSRVSALTIQRQADALRSLERLAPTSKDFAALAEVFEGEAYSRLAHNLTELR